MNKKILLVDDDIKVLSAMKRLMLFEGWEVLHVLNGDEALKIFEESSFDLVITDFKMPGMNGIELSDILKGKFPALPVILLTAYADKKLILKAFSNRTIVDIITKPWDEEVLLDKIRTHLSSKSPLTEPFHTPAVKVLIFEDDRTTIIIYEHWLKEAGFDFKVVRDGISGLELCQSWNPDIVILDLELPGMSGYSVLKKIRQEHNGREIIIIVATTRNDMEDFKACTKLGIQGYMLKPFSGRQILGEIMRCLSEHEKNKQL